MVRLRCQSTGVGGGVQRKLGTCRLFSSAIRSNNTGIPIDMLSVDGASTAAAYWR